MKKFFFSLAAVLWTVLVMAQEGGGGADKNIDVNINTEDGAWYASPWLWVIGGAVFVLLLVALTRGSGRRSDG